MFILQYLPINMMQQMSSQKWTIIVIVEEERLNREKHSAKFRLSIKYLLKTHNITLNEIDYVTISWKPD